jgi:hypothetical protein
MSRRLWLALALAVITAASFAASSVAAGPHTAAEPRPRTITKGLDYLHSRQTDAGGFGSMANTAWVILGAVASGERMGNNAWSVKGKNPFDYLQANSHEAAATGYDTDNAPVYYARAIMAYVAVGRVDRVYIAGTPRIDLLAQLYSYQDRTDLSPTKGGFSPSKSHRDYVAVHTTAWAILAMHAMGADGDPPFSLAVSWLALQHRSDGGFPSESTASATSNLEDTAMAIQALIAGGRAKTDPVVLDAKAYILLHQRPDGGFPYKPGGATDPGATSAAIQAAWALGDDPRTDPEWKVGSNTPGYALSVLQGKNGSYASKKGVTPRPTTSTSWALIALRGRPFTTFPLRVGSASTAFRFRPWTKSVSPKNGTKFNHTRIVLIRATYTDGAKGTGVKPSACRVYIDNANKSKPADIGRYGLHLQLTNVANGDHTYKLLIVDQAGNVKTVENKFKVNVVSPIPTSTPTPTPTYHPVYPTTRPVTPKPIQTLYPTPTTSGSPAPYSSLTPYPNGAPVTGAPVASPSPSGSPGAAGASRGGGGGSAAGFLGGTLVAMLPIGALLSYFAFRRRALALSGAGEGKTLGGGGSAWERAKQALGKSKDIVKPAGS